ncbi:MAG: YggT family protein [Candidatus Saccharimonadales bacterium]
MAQVYRETTTEPVETVRTEPVAAEPATAVAPVDRGSEHGMTVAARVIYLLGGILIALLAIRFLLSLLGANRGNGFADFIYSASHPFVSPFFGLFNYTEQFGRSRFEFETLIAILVYALVVALLTRLATIGSRRPDAA